EMMMRAVDLLYSLPYIFLVILLLVFFSRSILMLFVALGLVQWLTMARIVRGQVLSLKQQNFVEAARALGAGDGAIIFRHIVPNTLGPVIVYTTLTVPAVILQEAFLSFLRLGVPPPAASWSMPAVRSMRLCPVLWVLRVAAAASSAFSLPLQAQSRREHGLASYYGQVHDGRRTANGERFDMQAMTAAHRTLPFGTQVRVTNL